MARIHTSNMIQQNIGILPWRDENGTTNYPFANSVFDVSSVFVDGIFIQFDGYLPTLKSIQFTDTAYVFELLTYKGTVTGLLDYPAVSDTVTFTDSLGVFHGKLIVGDGLAILRQRYITSTLVLNIEVSPSAVRSIASASGVFSIDGYTDVDTFSGGTVQHIHFEPLANGVFVDAVYTPFCENNNPLLTINGASGNNITLNVPDILTLTPITGGVRIDLATKSALKIAQ